MLGWNTVVVGSPVYKGWCSVVGVSGMVLPTEEAVPHAVVTGVDQRSGLDHALGGVGSPAAPLGGVVVPAEVWSPGPLSPAGVGGCRPLGIAAPTAPSSIEALPAAVGSVAGVVVVPLGRRDVLLGVGGELLLGCLILVDQVGDLGHSGLDDVPEHVEGLLVGDALRLAGPAGSEEDPSDE